MKVNDQLLHRINLRLPARQIPLRSIGLLALVTLIIAAAFWYLRDAPLLSDESYNFRQISRLLRGDFSMEPEINVIPGYHALIAGLMAVFGKEGIFSARFFSS